MKLHFIILNYAGEEYYIKVLISAGLKTVKLTLCAINGNEHYCKDQDVAMSEHDTSPCF